MAKLKFQKKMSDLGLSEDQLSAGLRKKVAETLDVIGRANAQLTVAKTDSEKSEIQGDIDSMDDDMVAAIVKYHKNKPVYDANAARLAEARAAKSGKANVKPTVAQVAPAPIVAPIEPEPIVAVVEPTPDPIIEPIVAPDPIIEEKKGNGVGVVATVIGVGLALFFGYNFFKNN